MGLSYIYIYRSSCFNALLCWIVNVDLFCLAWDFSCLVLLCAFSSFLLPLLMLPYIFKRSVKAVSNHGLETFLHVLPKQSLYWEKKTQRSYLNGCWKNGLFSPLALLHLIVCLFVVCFTYLSSVSIYCFLPQVPQICADTFACFYFIF